MAGDRVTSRDAQVPINAYLHELATLLRGPRRRREDILAELRDGLGHAVNDHLAEGLTEAQAVTAAIAEFGTPQAIAHAFAGELATAYVRRTLTAYLATGPLVGIWWLLLLRPHPWHTGLIAIVLAIPVVPLIALAIATAATTLATTGSLIRWLPEAGPRRALTTALLIVGLVLAGDAAIIAIYARSDIPIQPLAILAVAASLIRIASGIITTRRLASMRHAMQTHLTRRRPAV